VVRETTLKIQQKPFHTSCAKKLTLNETPVITVTGKAFFDVGHSLKDQKANQRKPCSQLCRMGNSSSDGVAAR